MRTKKLMASFAIPRDENDNIDVTEDDVDANDKDDEEGTIIVKSKRRGWEEPPGATNRSS